MIGLVDRNGPIDGFLDAIRFASQFWGGLNFPLFSVDRVTTDNSTRRLLASFRPDFVFTTNCDVGSWSEAVNTACQPCKFFPVDQGAARESRALFWLNAIRANRPIVSRTELRGRPSRVYRPLSLIQDEPDTDLREYFAAIYGLHPQNVADDFFDEKILLSELRIQSAATPIALTTSGLRDGKCSWIEAIGHGLKCDGSFTDHGKVKIVLVNNPIEDLCLFWTLRATSAEDMQPFLLPIPLQSASEPSVIKAICDRISLLASAGWKTNACEIVSCSATKEQIMLTADVLSNSLQPLGIEFVDITRPPKILPRTVAYDHTTQWPARLLRGQLSLTPPVPTAVRCGNSQDAWFVDILEDVATGRALSEMQLPESAAIPEILNGACPPTIFSCSIVRRFSDAPDSLTAYVDRKSEVLRLQVPSATEVVEEILIDAGAKVLNDEKSSVYLPAIR